MPVAARPDVEPGPGAADAGLVQGQVEAAGAGGDAEMVCAAGLGVCAGSARRILPDDGEMLGVNEKVAAACSLHVIEGGGQGQQGIAGVKDAVFEAGRDDADAVLVVVFCAEGAEGDASTRVRAPVFKM